MDATPKGPPVPPTPDILSSIFSRGISDLNLTRRGQRYRRLSGHHPSLDAGRATETTAYASPSSSSCTCLYRLSRCESNRPTRPRGPSRVPKIRPGRRRGSIVVVITLGSGSTTTHKSEENHNSFRCRSGSGTRRPATNNGTPTILTILLYLPSAADRRITRTTAKATRTTFFTPVFTPRPRCHPFDAFYTTTPADDQPHRARKLRLLRGVDFPVKHIYRLRPEAPNSVPQPNRTREQCRAALPRVLWKKRRGEFAPIIASSTHSLIMRTTTSRRPSIRFCRSYH